MSISPLNIATNGFLAGATLAVAAVGLVTPDAVTPEVALFGGGQQRYVEHVEPRKPRIIHALDFELSSSAELVLRANSKHEFETKVPTEEEYNSLALFGYKASAVIQGKNVRVTELATTANLVIEATSEVENISAQPKEAAHSSSGTFAFNISSTMRADTAEQTTATHNSKAILSIAMKSTIETSSAIPIVDNEIEEVLAIAVNYLYG